MVTTQCKIFTYFVICIVLKLGQLAMLGLIGLFTAKNYHDGKLTLPIFCFAIGFISAALGVKTIILVKAANYYFRLNRRKDLLLNECLYFVCVFICLSILVMLMMLNPVVKKLISPNAAFYKSKEYNKNILSLANEINKNSDHIYLADKENEEKKNGTIFFTNNFVDSNSTISYKYKEGSNNTFSVSNEINENDFSANDKNNENSDAIFLTNIFKDNDNTISATKNIDLNTNRIISSTNKTIKNKQNEKTKNDASSSWQHNSSIYPNFDEQRPTNVLIANDSNRFSHDGFTLITKPIAYTYVPFYSLFGNQILMIICTVVSQLFIILLLYLHNKLICEAPVGVPINEQLEMNDMLPNAVNEEEDI